MKDIKNKIYNVRGKQVILDSDLAKLYGVGTKVLNQAVKRNMERFPEDFMFQLSLNEAISTRSQFVTLEKGKGSNIKYAPFAFTEQGVAMLSGVLKSKRAIEVNISIMRAFVSMRHFMLKNSNLFDRVEQIEDKLLIYDGKLDLIFNRLNDNLPKQGIFYDGQIFDSYKFIKELIKKAKSSIILIDNYVDYNTLSLFTDLKAKLTIYSKNITKQLEKEITKYEKQYDKVELKEFENSHDRFIIIDNKEVYHIGASLKDIGKKWFAFSKMKLGVNNVIKRLS